MTRKPNAPLTSILTALLLVAALMALAPARAYSASAEYDKGVAYLRAGKAEEALAILGPLAEARKDDPYLQYHAGLAYYKLGRLDDALASFTKTHEIAKDKPSDEFGLGSAFSNLGIAFYRDGRYDEAKGCFATALAISPSDGDSRYYLGLTLIEQGEYGNASDELAEAAKLLKGDDAACAVSNALGMSKMRQGDNEAAITQFTKTLDINQDNIEALYYLGQLNYKERGYAAARPYFDRLTHIGATDKKNKATLFTTFFNMGVDFQDRGMSETAADMFERAISLDPDDAEAHYYRGYNLMALDRYEDASAEFRKALSIDPSMKRATAQLEVAARFASEHAVASGKAKAANDEFYAAIPYYERAVSLDPGNDAAVKGLKEVTQLAKKDSEARLDRARSALARGEYKDAMVAVDGLLKLDPSYSGADSVKKQIASKMSEETGALLAKAAVSEKKDELGDALASYKRVLEILPDNRPAKEGAARIEDTFAKLRKKAAESREGGLLVQARDSYKKLLDYLPGDWEAPSALAEVEQDIKTELAKRLKAARDSFGAEDYTMASHHTSRALELDPANDEALALKQRVKDRSKELVLKYVKEGNAYLEDGKNDKARDSFQAALALDPDSSAARKGLDKASYVPPSAKDEDEVRKLYLQGVEYYTKGELEKAVESWRAVLKMDPGNEKAASSIKRAEEKIKQTGDN